MFPTYNLIDSLLTAYAVHPNYSFYHLFLYSKSVTIKYRNISNKGLKNVSLESLQNLEERTKTFSQYFGSRYDDKKQADKAVEIEKYLNENKRYIYGAALQNMNEAEYLLENMYSTGKGKGLRNQALDDVYNAIEVIKEKEHDITPSEVFGVSERKRLNI